MICTGCNQKFELNQGRFHKVPKKANGQTQEFYCSDCNPKVPIDATTQTMDRAGPGRDPGIESPAEEPPPFDRPPLECPF